ncbi:MAG: hypothetical protein AAFW64_00065 [Pseudomonadota bacterium]
MCEVVPLQGVSIVLARTALASARAKARLQVELAKGETAFLPTAPSSNLGRKEAITWTMLNQSALIKRLLAVRGAAQVSAQVFVSEQILKPEAGESWLRGQARRRARRIEQRTLAMDMLDRAAHGLPSLAMGQRELVNSAALDLLVPRTSVDNVRDRLAERLNECAQDCAVAGPLPVYGFSDLSGAPCKTI